MTHMAVCQTCVVVFFSDTAPTGIYTLSLHDALPICGLDSRWRAGVVVGGRGESVKMAMRVVVDNGPLDFARGGPAAKRSEEHTSELQSRLHLVCRLLLEKKKVA